MRIPLPAVAAVHGRRASDRDLGSRWLDQLHDLRGTWRLADGLPSEADLDRDVRTASAAQRLRFDTSALTGWDSSLVTFLVGLIDAVRQRGVDVDCTSLPEGVQRLLALVDVTPETMAHPEPRPSFRARRQRNTRRVALYESGVGVPGGSDARFRPASPGPCSAPAIRSLPRDSRGWRTCAADRHADQRVDWDDLGFRRRRHPAQLRRHHLRGRSRCHSAGAGAWRHHDGHHHGRSNGLRVCGGAGIDACLQEIDALVTMGIAPIEFTVLNRLLALALMMPVLCVYADFLGIVGGGIVATNVLGVTLSQYTQEIKESITLTTFAIGIGKGAVFGVVVAMCGCLAGLRAGAERGRSGRGRDQAVVSAIVWIIVLDGLFAVVLYILGL